MKEQAHARSVAAAIRVGALRDFEAVDVERGDLGRPTRGLGIERCRAELGELTVPLIVLLALTHGERQLGLGQAGQERASADGDHACGRRGRLDGTRLRGRRRLDRLSGLRCGNDLGCGVGGRRRKHGRRRGRHVLLRSRRLGRARCGQLNDDPGGERHADCHSTSQHAEQLAAARLHAVRRADDARVAGERVVGRQVGLFEQQIDGRRRRGHVV